MHSSSMESQQTQWGNVKMTYSICHMLYVILTCPLNSIPKWDGLGSSITVSVALHLTWSPHYKTDWTVHPCRGHPWALTHLRQWATVIITCPTVMSSTLTWIGVHSLWSSVHTCTHPGSAKVYVQHGLLSQVGGLCDSKDTLLSWNVLL